MNLLLPGEHVEGTAAESAHLLRLLSCFRADPPPRRLRDVTGLPLPALLMTDIIDADLFTAGYMIMIGRYRKFGIQACLPLERVWVGTSSVAPPGSARAFGGFHHPDQGYRHVQMDAAVTVYGDLTGERPASPKAVALDLLRCYAHDCLHYAAFRRYQLTDRGEIARVQYGINMRHPDGRTYSARDLPGDGATRNLGILMEGATDAEATLIARQTAETAGLKASDVVSTMPGYVFADVTGTLKPGDFPEAANGPYARSVAGFHRTVTSRYRTLLGELSDIPGEPHEQFVNAMITGNVTLLEAGFDARNGPGSFVGRFRAPSYGAARPVT